MSKLDNIKRIIVEDFPKESKETVEKLAYILNSFMEQTIAQINGNLDFDNLAKELVYYTVTVNASGVPIGNDLIKTGIRNPKGLIVISAKNQDSSSTYATQTPFVNFTLKDNLLKVQKITGLPANNKFILTIMVIP